jgi:hypothetical protein
MGGILGGGNTNATSTQKYTQLDTQTSAYGLPIRLFWGKKRLAPNVVWANDFLAIPEKNGKKGGGGKGGGGKGAGGVVYDYFVAVILALCEGPLTGIDKVWADKDVTTLAALGLTLIPGAADDAVWSYLTTNHPDQADAYAYTAKLVNSRYSLGKSPNLPTHNFEAISPLSGSMPGTVDCNFGDIIPDFLTNPQYSIGLTSGVMDATSLAFFKTYQQAQGIFVSPDLDTQEQLSSVMDRWAQLSNSWIFFSGGTIKFVPLGDAEITANSVTYTPNLTAQYDLTYEDFVTDDPTAPPITVSTEDVADLPNHVPLEIMDRSLDYNANTIEWRDEAMILDFGTVDSSATQAHEICDASVAAIVAQLIGQRGTIQRTYKFMLGAEFFLLEPGDILSLNDDHIGLSAFPVRVRTMDEDEQGRWSIVAEELALGVGSVAGAMPQQTVTPFQPDFEADPGDVNPPAIFEPDSSLTGGTAQVYIAASGGPDWGGCIVHLSFDGVTYSAIGSISNPATQGVLTAILADSTDPDSTNTLSIDTTESDQVSPTDATTDDADAFRTLSWITPSYTTTAPSNGELIAYGSVAAGAGAFDSDLTYLRRGLYGTTHASHASGSFFTRVELNRSQPPGNTVLISDLPDQYVGATLTLKFQSFNRFARALQDLSSVTAYTYVPSGAGAGTTPLPINTPTLSGSATLTADQVILDYVATIDFELLAGLSGFVGGVALNGVTTTADTTFTLYKNSTSIGTVKIPAGATLGASSATVVGFASTVTFVAGTDHFRVIAQHTPDATLAGPFFGFVGQI